MQILASGIPEDSPECDHIHEEAAADVLNHQILEHLSASFIPPLDPIDVHDVAEAIDDVIDQMDEAAKRVCQFHVRTTRPEFVEQTGCWRSNGNFGGKRLASCDAAGGRKDYFTRHWTGSTVSNAGEMRFTNPRFPSCLRERPTRWLHCNGMNCLRSPSGRSTAA